MTFRILLMATLVLLPSCVRMEGDLANECIDHADNDRDGLYDCDDPDCFGSPDCVSDDSTFTATASNVAGTDDVIVTGTLTLSAS